MSTRSVVVVMALATVAACTPAPRYPDPPADSYSTKRAALNEGEQVVIAEVSAEFFSTGLLPALGRRFIDPEYGGAQIPVAMVSHRCWEERFGSDVAVLGRVVRVDDTRRTIVGVAPPGFDVPAGVCVWIPRIAPQTPAR